MYSPNVLRGGANVLSNIDIIFLLNDVLHGLYMKMYSALIFHELAINLSLDVQFDIERVRSLNINRDTFN